MVKVERPSKARTNDLDHGVTAATSLPAQFRWRSCSGARRTRQPIVDRASATLMSAGRNRNVSIRRKLPQTWNAAGVAGEQRVDGDLACDGGWLARPVNAGHLGCRSAR